ncbi:MAG: YjgN family protein [Nitrospira sp.]|nr:YjgN family protein [Nitrospira sp.]
MTRPSFHGRVGTVFGMQIGNMFLTLLTLGVYHFWAKAKVRKYFFSQTELAGDRFMYHGTGKELCIGFLKAGMVFGVPYFALNGLPAYIDLPRWAITVCSVLLVLLPWVFAPIAVIGARRYRMSRISWRGIRFSFHGRVRPFLALMLKGTALTALTLGAYYPYYQTKRQEYLVNHTRLGNRSFNFDGTGAELAPGFVLTPLVTFFAVMIPMFVAYNTGNFRVLLLLPFTVGPVWIWFLAKKQRFFWNHTVFGRVRFQSTMTPRALVNLYVGNFLLLIATLGFAWPWTTVRTLQFHLQNLALVGPLDLHAVLQESGEATVTQEGLANLLDSGFEFD